MSFYSYRSASNDICPGRIEDEATKGLCERVCIQVNKVYDACLQQETLSNIRVELCKVRPAGTTFVPPLTLISCRSTSTKGILKDLQFDRLPDRPNFSRVRANVEIPIEVTFTDSTGRQGTGNTVITVHKDVILYVPDESVIPYTAEAVVSAICVSGEYIDDFRFDITCCVTVILKIVAEVELLIPAYGFCRIPPCEEYAENVCEDFFELPIFPPQYDDKDHCKC